VTAQASASQPSTAAAPQAPHVGSGTVTPGASGVPPIAAWQAWLLVAALALIVLGTVRFTAASRPD